MDIGGREVDTRHPLEIAMDNTAYDQNKVYLEKRMSKDYVDELQREGDAYMTIKSAKEAKLARARMDELAEKYHQLAAALKNADVKDDDGDHSDHEDVHLSEYNGEVYVKDDRSKKEEKFQSWHDACNYVESLHGDERFESHDAAREDEDKHEDDDKDKHEREDKRRDAEDKEDDDLDEGTREAHRLANIIRSSSTRTVAKHAKDINF